MRTSGIAACLVLVSTLGCKSRPEKKPVATASASAPVRLPPPDRRRWPLPSGPVLPVLASQGVGPIRLGATVATIERQMALPCDVKTPEVCRYIGRGVEFWLENGVTQQVYVQRAGRPAGKNKDGSDAEFGFFRGAIPPDVQLGMIPSAIQEVLGPPRKVEKRDAPGTANQVETHDYEGMRIEYDRIENGNLVMGGIRILKEPKSDAGGVP